MLFTGINEDRLLVTEVKIECGSSRRVAEIERVAGKQKSGAGTVLVT
jgi:hypothetical protein